MAMAMVSSSSAAVAVDKATSDLLIGPDWTMNIDICDSLNSNPSLAKDVAKAVKRRMQHKNPKVQLLALTLLETMVKNCGDYVHFQIVEKNILGEMIKIVKKKTDMHVRDKILVLLDSWQEAFGGPGGKHPQYYWAYEELRHCGIQFPRRSPDAAPIFTPPVTHPALRHSQAGYGMPSNSSRKLDEAMSSEIEDLSLSNLDSMRNAMELLNDMLQAVNPVDHEAVKDEVIVDLVNNCRSKQKKLMQMLTTTGDEELLGQGLELNDSLQMLLAKHDAIASGSPMPTQITSLSSKPSEGSSSTVKPSEERDCSPSHFTTPTEPVANMTRSPIDEEEDEEDDFAQLARRHSRAQSISSQSTSGTSVAPVPMDASNIPSSPVACNALALPDPPAPVRTTKEQDMIDLLSITLSTMSTSPHPQAPPSASQNMSQLPITPSTQGYPHVSQTYPGNQGQIPYNSYVVPWAQPQPQHQSQASSQPQLQPQFQDQLQPQNQPQIRTLQQSWPHPRPQQQWPPQPQSQPQHQPQLPQQQWSSQPQPQLQLQLQAQCQPQLQSQYPQYSSGYPPPPWAATPGYANGHLSTANNMFLNPRVGTTASFTPMQASRPLQHHNSFPSRGSNGSSMNGDPRVSSNLRSPAPPGGEKPFIPSYRLFEDLNILGNADGRLKMASGTSSTLSGTSGQSMVGGRK